MVCATSQQGLLKRKELSCCLSGDGALFILGPVDFGEKTSCPDFCFLPNHPPYIDGLMGSR
jgi:hypothetical protein